jgi:hypothetical protein
LGGAGREFWVARRERKAVARTRDGARLLKCSFCGKGEKQVRKLIAGPGVYICDGCVDLCNEILEEELGERPVVEGDGPPERERQGTPVKNLSLTEPQSGSAPVHDQPEGTRAALGDATVTVVDTRVLIVTIPAGHEVIVRTSSRDEPCS